MISATTDRPGRILDRDSTQPTQHLGRLVAESAALRPDHPAVEDESGRFLTYQELDRAADRVATRLARWGIGRGDRVGLFLPKSIESVTAIHAILRSGAAYVPVDATAPVGRGAAILASASVSAIIVSAESVGPLRELWPQDRLRPRLIVVGAAPIGSDDSLWEEVLHDDAPTPLPPPCVASDLAYILFTSGSTGTPKGVMLSHENAFTFLDWCERSFLLTDQDRFASHAPFHFDLSIFDLYASARRGATLLLISESTGKDPVRLAAFIAEKRVDVWYSAPSILAWMSRLEAVHYPEYPAPRLVLFAGEVFPIGALRQLRQAWHHSEMWNLYGPTETNVCTAQAIPLEIPDDRSTPFPIGQVCPPLEAKIVDELGRDVSEGTTGELWISGSGVCLGYFGRPDLTEPAFVVDDVGKRWYRTGDLAVDDGSGTFCFHGRRDRMVKKRGYRIELGEVESALDSHEGVAKAAVVARADDEAGVTLEAFIALKPNAKRSSIAIKRHCVSRLPSYMIPDTITFLTDMPMTSTDKVDYQRLKHLA